MSFSQTTKQYKQVGKKNINVFSGGSFSKQFKKIVIEQLNGVYPNPTGANSLIYNKIKQEFNNKYIYNESTKRFIIKRNYIIFVEITKGN